MIFIANTPFSSRVFELSLLDFCFQPGCARAQALWVKTQNPSARLSSGCVRHSSFTTNQVLHFFVSGGLSVASLSAWKSASFPRLITFTTKLLTPTLSQQRVKLRREKRDSATWSSRVSAVTVLLEQPSRRHASTDHQSADGRKVARALTPALRSFYDLLPFGTCVAQVCPDSGAT